MLSPARILIVGASSVVAPSLKKKLEDLGNKVFLSGRDKLFRSEFVLDLNEQESFTPFLHQVAACSITHVIWLAAVTSEHKCRDDITLARRVNVEASSEIIHLLVQLGVHVSVFSSSAIFSDEQALPNINSPMNAVSVYGKLKMELESNLENLGDQVAIIRPTKILSYPFALIEKVLQCCEKEEEVTVFDDHFFAPISLLYAVEQTCEIVRNSKTGHDAKHIKPIAAKSKSVTAVKNATLSPFLFNKKDTSGQPIQQVISYYLAEKN